MSNLRKYLQGLTRCDCGSEQKEAEKWERLYAALAEGLSFEESDYKPMSASEVKQRARKRHGLSL